MFTRRFTRQLTLLAALLFAGTSSACNDRTLLSAPDAPATAKLGLKRGVGARSAVASAPIVRRTRLLASDETACELVPPTSPSGSRSISLKNAGLKVTFPNGAVSAPTNVCLVAHAGSLLTYSFYPHGLQFAANLTVQQDLRGTTAYHNSLIMSTLMGGYLANDVKVDVDLNGVGSFAQVFSVYADDEAAPLIEKGTFVKFFTNHFSGYALASGRE